MRILESIVNTKEPIEEVHPFEVGKQAMLATNGNYYFCTEYYGDAYEIAGNVKRVNYKKAGSFIDVGQDDDMCNEADRMNTYYLRITLENAGYDVRWNSKTRSVIVQGYKIKFDGLGYSMYDKYRGQKLNVMDFNRDFATADHVIDFLEASSIELETRIDEAKDKAAKRKKTVVLRNFEDYESFVRQQIEDGKSSKALFSTESKVDVHAKNLQNATDWLDGKLSNKLFFSRFRKILKSYPRDWMRFQANAGRVAKSKISRKDFVEYVDELLTEFGV